ncbi:HNH endonuclease [Kitasatospora cathayae]|uniref:HNH endonuclease n=1 Tax=Kitasatospora cathayae TaxID=3004092 RepID=UPI003860198B
MASCELCGREKPAEDFLAGKARKPSRACQACRNKRRAAHVKNYYRRLSPDKRHTVTHKRRAEAYGVEHVEYSRTAILRRWRYRCAYCDERATHLDHVVPLARGGADAESNVVPACASCNLSKGAKTLAEWMAT